MAATITVSLFLANNSVNAQDLQKVTLKVQKITYSDIGKCYYVYTEKDQNGGRWVIDVQPAKGETLKQLRKKYIGRKITITYAGDEQSDEEVEIVNSVIE